MSLDSIIGQPLAVDLCHQWLKRNTTNPVLFYGPDGVGKKTLALEVAKALNCASHSPSGSLSHRERDGAAQGEACACISCRKIAVGTHPDVRVIDFAWQALEKKEPVEKQQNLKIETILNERHRLLQSPVEGAWKVSIFDDAHRFTPDAANVLLKILEEPPAYTALFLVTPFRDRLFATLLSRCQPVRFRALSDDEMKRCLTHLNIPPERHAKLAEMALGSPGRAIHWSREEQIEAMQEAEHVWESLAKEPAGKVMKDSRSKSFKPQRADIERQINSLLIPATRELRSGKPSAAIPVRHIQSALTQLRQNVQPALVYDYLILQLSKAKQ